MKRRPPAPVLDPRNREAILAALLAHAPGYTPEWMPAPGRPGYALLSILARYLDILLEGMNAMPDGNRLAFLEMLGNSRLPAQSARAPLTFKLLDTAPLDVTLPAKSQVAGKVQPPPPSPLDKNGESQAIAASLFFTEQTITLTRGSLAVLYSVDPGSDAYADHSAVLTRGFTMFDALQPVPHILYLGHDELFRLSGIAEVTLSFDLGAVSSAASLRPLLLDWEYLSKDGWLPLQIREDNTERFTQDGKITLVKDCGPDAKDEEIGGHKSYWIRGLVSTRTPSSKIVTEPAGGTAALVEVDDTTEFLPGDVVTTDGVNRATIVATSATEVTLDAPLRDITLGNRLMLADSLPPLRPEGTDAEGALPSVDMIRARVGFSKAELPPDQAYTDTTPLNTTNNFYPFGQQPAAYTTFYLASEEVFQRRGAKIRIEVDLAKPGVAGSALGLGYEYFNGSNWMSFSSNDEFADDTKAFMQDGALRFICPDNWSKTTVNGVENYWMRIRLDAGDYGHPLRLKVVPDGSGGYKVESEASTLAPPVVAVLTLGYTYFTMPALLDHCLAYNDFAITDHSEDCRWPRRMFQPFLPIGDRQPAVHFGFTQKPPSGLISLFLAVSHDRGDDPGPSPFTWEYRSMRGWTELPVLDETDGFTASGVVQFVGSPDAVAADGLGGPLYRIRARLKPDLRLESRPVDGVWLNTVWGRQGETVQNDLLGLSDGNPGQTLRFPPLRVPVLPGETIEVREWSGRGEDWATAVQDVPVERLRFERDPVTNDPLAVWVRWEEHPHLYASGPNDRHYLLERAGGRLIFGDQRHGMIPPAGARILASYATGGGLQGNVAIGQISQLRTGVGYVESVTNWLPARGGAATEGARALSARAPERVRHRGRAVAVSDYEWLAHEATPEVARARCLTLMGVSGRPEIGWVSLIVVPWSTDPQPQPSIEMLDRVRRFLEARLPAGGAATLRLLPAAYTVVSVSAEIVPVHPDEAALVEARVRDRLQRYFHPLTGRADGAGWEFGQAVYLSEIAALIETTPGVDYTSWLRLKSMDAFFGDLVSVPPNALPAGGDHQLKLTVVGARYAAR